MRLFYKPKGLNLPFTHLCDESTLEKVSVKKVYLDFKSFTYLHLKLEIKEGDVIEKGQKIAFDVHQKKRAFISPFGGKVLEVYRGKYRKVIYVLLEKNNQASPIPKIDSSLGKDKLLESIFEAGGSFFIHKRPFHRVININDIPRSIFINTVTTAPYAPSFTHILKGNEALFQKGLSLLAKFAKVSLIHDKQEFSRFRDVCKYSISGKHPAESPSIAIAAIDPIKDPKDVVWSLDVYDVLHLGALVDGKMFTSKIISLCGDDLDKQKRTLVETSKGCDIKEIIGEKGMHFSGDPITGSLNSPYLLEKDVAIVCTMQKEIREILPFLKPGLKKFSATSMFAGKFLKKDTSLSLCYKKTGEVRPFVLKDIYKQFIPLNIEVEPLIKALLSKNYELAICYGFLDITTKDLALCQYICPSKINFMQIFDKACDDYIHLNAD